MPCTKYQTKKPLKMSSKRLMRRRCSSSLSVCRRMPAPTPLAMLYVTGMTMMVAKVASGEVLSQRRSRTSENIITPTMTRA